MAFRRRRTYRKKRNPARRRYKKNYKRRVRPTKFNRSLTSYNPQYMRVKRKIDFLVPELDVNRGTYGCYKYLSVAASSTTLNSYSSAAYFFKISDIYNVSEFGNLFDQYKITGIKLKFIYMTATEAPLDLNAGNLHLPQCTMLAWQDNDDVTAPTASNAGWAAAQENGRIRAKVFPNNRGNQMNIFLRPKVLTAIVDTTGATAGRGNLNPWLDGATAQDAEYFGLKVLLQCPPNLYGQPAHYFKAIATYYTVWRNRH